MKHFLTSSNFDNDGGFIYCSENYVEYDPSDIDNSYFIDEVNCNQCLEKYNKFLQLKEKFECKCFCHNTQDYGEIKSIGHIGRFRVCCFNCPKCDFKIDKNLEKEHEQYHAENI
jgi:hypothetical protein